MPLSNLWSIYQPLIGWTIAGWLLGRWLPRSAPAHLGKLLFWVGVPLGILAFLRHAEVSFSLWVAPLVAWVTVLLGLAVASYLLRSLPLAKTWGERTRGSFLLASMVGNTGYIGFPVALGLVGPAYFAWALFYDLLGSTPAAYGLGVTLAARFGNKEAYSLWQSLQVLVKNPALWSFGVGLWGRNVPLPAIVESGLHQFAWSVISLSLVLVGMRLSHLSSFKSIRPALLCVAIKMVLLPLVLGTLLKWVGISGMVHRVLLLQMAMPPAFATLVLSEAYELDQELAVTALITGSTGLLLTLPLWLWLFG